MADLRLEAPFISRQRQLANAFEQPWQFNAAKLSRDRGFTPRMVEARRETSNSSVTEPRYITDIIYFADKEEDGEGEEREREISGTFRGNERRKIFHVGIGSEERAWKRQQDASVWERNSGRLGRRAGREWYTGQYYRAIRSQMPG